MFIKGSASPEKPNAVNKKENKTPSLDQSLLHEVHQDLQNMKPTINPRTTKKKVNQMDQDMSANNDLANFAPIPTFDPNTNFIKQQQMMPNLYNNQYHNSQNSTLRQPFLFSPPPLFNQQFFIIQEPQMMNCPPMPMNSLVKQGDQNALNFNQQYFSNSNPLGTSVTNPLYSYNSLNPASKELFQQFPYVGLNSEEEKTSNSLYKTTDSRSTSWSDGYTKQKNFISASFLHEPLNGNNSAPPITNSFVSRAANKKKFSLPHSIKLPSLSQLRKNEAIKLPQFDLNPNDSIVRQPQALSCSSSNSFSNTSAPQNINKKENEKQINKKKYVRPLKFNCQVCQKRFHRQDALQTHMNMHLGLKPYECHFCGRCFNAKQNMVRHEKTHATARKKEKRIDYQN